MLDLIPLILLIINTEVMNMFETFLHNHTQKCRIKAMRMKEKMSQD